MPVVWACVPVVLKGVYPTKRMMMMMCYCPCYSATYLSYRESRDEYLALMACRFSMV